MPDKVSHFWRITALVTAETILALIFFAGALAVLVFLTRKRIRKYKYIDLAIFKKLENRANISRNRSMLFFTFLGKHQFLIPANLLLIFYFLFIRIHTWFSIRVAVIGLSSLVLMLLLKSLFRRKRPLAPLLHAVKGLSFPSGHAIMAVTFYGLIIYIFFHTIENKPFFYFLATLLIILIFLIGFSRIYLRVHYASDVVAGFIIGFLWLLISLSLLGKVEAFIQVAENTSIVQEIKGPNMAVLLF